MGTERPRALELFAGIGGFAAAAGEHVEVVGALDVSSHVLQAYARTFGGPTDQVNLEAPSVDELAAYDAQMWWMSPPCQPYTVRGHQRDLEDVRARSFVHLLELLDEVEPPHLAMENVEGFWRSQARQRLLEVLEGAGYEVAERVLCPTELGVPARRERYYLVASRQGLRPEAPLAPVERALPSYLDEEPDEELFLDPALVERHGRGMRIVDVDDEGAICNCFTSAYGKTFRAAGSFFRHPDGRVRHASPAELLRLLHFPRPVDFPGGFSRRQRYKYIGNSLSVIAVRQVLSRMSWWPGGPLV